MTMILSYIRVDGPGLHTPQDSGQKFLIASSAHLALTHERVQELELSLHSAIQYNEVN